MNALVLEDIGKLEYREIETATALSGEVLVKVKAAGVCGSDIPRSYKDGAHKMPLILGHEFSGQVVAVGENASSEWIGKRVGIFPLIPCKKCSQCKAKRYEMCKHYDYLGSRRNGGFAEFVSVPEWNLIELPENVSYEVAAMLEPMAVATHAIRRLKLSSEDSALVYGAGTIGMLLTMFLIDKKINNIYVACNKDFQINMLKQIGICEENICDIRKEDLCDFINEKTSGEGIEAVFECVGNNETIATSLKVVAPSGQICYVGNPHSDMTFDKNVYWQILRKQITICGTWNSSFYGVNESEIGVGNSCNSEGPKNDVDGSLDDWNYVLDRLERGKVVPNNLITHKFLFEDIKKGFEIMRDKKEDYVKIMAVME